MKDSDFILLDIENLKLDFTDNYPSSLMSWIDKDLILDNNSTHFGFVYQGNIEIDIDGKIFPAFEGMYFSLNNKAKIISKGNSKGFIASKLNYHGFFSLGGPVENKGRYNYIDGCSDSLLISPVLKGDPCFNFLYFPKNINQTPHTHPSIRIGMIISGSGKCIMKDKTYELNQGQLFVINPDTLHSFKTDNSDMKIVVYHPESDFGPTDKNHPMINKTIINGVSAALL